MDFGDSDFGNFMLDDFEFFGNNLDEIRKLPPAWISDVCLYVCVCVCVCVNHSQNLFQQPLYTFQAYVVKVPISALQITYSIIFRCGVLLHKVPLALSCTFIHTCDSCKVCHTVSQIVVKAGVQWESFVNRTLQSRLCHIESTGRLAQVAGARVLEME